MFFFPLVSSGHGTCLRALDDMSRVLEATKLQSVPIAKSAHSSMHLNGDRWGNQELAGFVMRASAMDDVDPQTPVL